MIEHKKFFLYTCASNVCIDGDWLYITENEHEDNVRLIRYSLNDIISNTDNLHKEIITEFKDYVLDICVCGDYVILATDDSLFQININTKEKKIIRNNEAISLTLCKNNVYVSFGNYGGLVRYQCSENGLENPEILYPYSYSTHILNDDIVLNRDAYESVSYIKNKMAMPLVSLLDSSAMGIIKDGFQSKCINGFNSLYFIREMDTAVFKAKDFETIREINQDDLVRLPFKLEHLAKGSASVLYYRPFRNGVVLEFYDNVVYINDTDYVDVCDEGILSLYTDEKHIVTSDEHKITICVIE